MFNHQYNFDINIPNEVITKEKHDHIFEELLENKVLIGLCGYGKSGKDTIAKNFIDDYGFHRVAFADNIKIEMNKYLKESVLDDLMGNKKNYESIDSYFDPEAYSRFYNRNYTIDDIDFKTENLDLKKVLRPYIIWYGEKLREINGPYYWINKAFEIDAAGYNKIILSDVRREKELDVFENSRSLRERRNILFANAGCAEKMPYEKSKNYSSLLFHVSQLGLTDSDKLTHDCIRIAQEKWLFDHTFYVDPEIPGNGDYRERFVRNSVREVASKFGIQKPDKKINFPGKQSSILDNLK